MSSAAAELIEVPLSDRKLVERFIRVPWYVNRSTTRARGGSRRC